MAQPIMKDPKNPESEPGSESKHELTPLPEPEPKAAPIIVPVEEENPKPQLADQVVQ